MSLLCEVMARLHGVNMPVIQFIHVTDTSGAAEIAIKFAKTSATYLGRTLLVRLSASQAQISKQRPVASDVTIAGELAQQTIAEPFKIVPDSAVLGLSHASIGAQSETASQMSRIAAESWLDGIALDFRLIVIASDPPEHTPATLDLATRCHGSLLVVSAGRTGLSDIRTVTRQVRLAGGTLMGTVLYEAPATPNLRIFPWWPRRAAYPT
jgi:hypothetical protein